VLERYEVALIELLAVSSEGVDLVLEIHTPNDAVAVAIATNSNEER
jgi:hypothetical protein